MTVSRVRTLCMAIVGCLSLIACSSGDEEELTAPCTEENKNPVITYWATPEYPQEAADAGLEGETIVKVLILADATVGCFPPAGVRQNQV